MAVWNSISYICTRARHSLLSFAYYHAASTVIHLLPKATFIPSIRISSVYLVLALHLLQVHSLSFSHHFSYPMPLLRTTPLVQLLLQIETSPILYCSAHFSVLPIYAIYPSFILCTTSLPNPPPAEMDGSLIPYENFVPIYHYLISDGRRHYSSL